MNVRVSQATLNIAWLMSVVLGVYGSQFVFYGAFAGPHILIPIGLVGMGYAAGMVFLISRKKIGAALTIGGLAILSRALALVRYGNQPLSKDPTTPIPQSAGR